jgi:REP element-mobilizing transposase RayT
VARKPRENVVGGIYHVFARGNDRRPVFVDDADRYAYLMILSEVCGQAEWTRLAHCLMNNHVHLLLETPLPNLSEGMQRIQSRYAQRFNRRHDRSGHLFQGRFKSVRVVSDAQLITVTRYIAMNPVEAGLCESAELWHWSDCSEARSRCDAVYGKSAGGQTPSVGSDPERGV